MSSEFGRSNSSLGIYLESISEANGVASSAAAETDLSLAEASSHLEDLVGLVIEYLEKNLAHRSKWFTGKMLNKLEVELRRSSSLVPVCRLSEFYVMFQTQSTGLGQDRSGALRKSFRRREMAVNSGSSLSLESEVSGKSRLSRSSDTLDTRQTSVTEGITECSFELSGGEDNPSSEQPISMPLGKVTKRASKESNPTKGHRNTEGSLTETGSHMSSAGYGPFMGPCAADLREKQAFQTTAKRRTFEDKEVQVCMEAVSFSSMSGRPPPLPGSPRSRESVEPPRHRSESSNRFRRNGPNAENGNRILSTEPMLSAFQDTPYESMRTSLEWTMSHWNPLKYSACCPFHSSCQFAKVVVHDLCNDPCIPLWSPLTDWQCKTCFCMNHVEKETCHMCQDSRPPSESNVSYSDSRPSLTSSGSQWTIARQNRA
jgi:hypothetical protein